MRRFALAPLLLLAACSQGPPEIATRDAWARETAPGQATAAVYLTIANAGGSDDRLVEVSSTAASSASLHTSSHDGGVARMRPVEGGLAIPAGGTVTLGPGGEHIMLTSLRAPLRPGGEIGLRLRFERSGERNVAAGIRAAAGAEQAH